MTDTLDDFLDDLFHGAAVAAYVDQLIEERRSPDSEKTRARAYRYYEQALAEKNRLRSGEPKG
jgi:hypothetical protein